MKTRKLRITGASFHLPAKLNFFAERHIIQRQERTGNTDRITERREPDVQAAQERTGAGDPF